MKTLKIGKAISDGVNVVKDNPIMILIGLLYGVVIKLVEPKGLDQAYLNSDFFSIISSASINLAFIILIGIFVNGIMIVLSAKGRKFSLGSAINLVCYKFFVLLFASIVSFMIIGLGFIALIIPGIFLSMRLLFYEQAILLNNKGIVDSLKMSWNVAKGNWWRIFGLAILISLISLLISVPLDLINKTIADFVAATFIVPWVAATYTKAYLQLKR